MTENASDLPETAKPTVFHHEGRRLFVIDGEPRVADEDLAGDLEMSRVRDIRSNLIDPNRERLLILGDILQVDPKARALVRIREGGEPGQLRFDNAVAEQLFGLLKAERLLDLSKRGEKPKINFLNAEQAKFLIVASATPRGREILVDLIKLDKAWKDGNLAPARPALEPPKATVAPKPTVVPFPSPSTREPDVEFGHRNGVLFALVEDTHHVLEDSLAEIR